MSLNINNSPAGETILNNMEEKVMENVFVEINGYTVEVKGKDIEVLKKHLDGCKIGCCESEYWFFTRNGFDSRNNPYYRLHGIDPFTKEEVVTGTTFDNHSLVMSTVVGRYNDFRNCLRCAYDKSEDLIILMDTSTHTWFYFVKKESSISVEGLTLLKVVQREYYYGDIENDDGSRIGIITDNNGSIKLIAQYTVDELKEFKHKLHYRKILNSGGATLTSSLENVNAKSGYCVNTFDGTVSSIKDFPLSSLLVYKVLENQDENFGCWVTKDSKDVDCVGIGHVKIFNVKEDAEDEANKAIPFRKRVQRAIWEIIGKSGKSWYRNKEGRYVDEVENNRPETYIDLVYTF